MKDADSARSAAYLALLRGINVGGKNKLSMQSLQAMFVAAGCDHVQTYIQSGNVVFRADPEVAAQIGGRITEQITAEFGYHIPLVVRTADELRAVILHNPYVQAGIDTETLHILFLADLPDSQFVAALDAARSVPDAFTVRSREIYLHLPQGAARTKLTNAYFDARLHTTSTQRNWRTVTALLALMGE